jgi:hypothetical protein
MRDALSRLSAESNVDVSVVIPRSIKKLSGDFDAPEGTPSSVVLSDLNDIDGSDMIVINLLYLVEGDKVSLASTMEMFYAAHVLRIPVLVIADGAQAIHPWVKHYAMDIVPSVFEALKHIKERWVDSGGFNRPTSN